MLKRYKNKLPCVRTIIKLARKRRIYSMLAIRTVCGENTSCEQEFTKIKLL